MSQALRDHRTVPMISPLSTSTLRREDGPMPTTASPNFVAKTCPACHHPELVKLIQVGTVGEKRRLRARPFECPACGQRLTEVEVRNGKLAQA